MVNTAKQQPFCFAYLLVTPGGVVFGCVATSEGVVMSSGAVVVKSGGGGGVVVMVEPVEGKHTHHMLSSYRSHGLQ